VPLVELPAYETPIGAAFYSSQASGAYVFPQAYRGGAFVAAHGSWHQVNGAYAAIPQVVFVPMNAGTPQLPVDWSNPNAQWKPFLTGFQKSDGITRIGRPTGVAVGSQGSLFVADDGAGAVYRIRP
jgi:glucose/arabinose dehydrogenase